MVYTIRFNKKIALAVIVASSVLLAGLVLLMSLNSDTSGEEQGLSDNEEMIEFLEGQGWRVDPEPINVKQIVIPKEFSEVYESYNDLQKAQGYDLEDFKGAEATVYTYSIKNYTGYEGEVVADLYIRKNKIIGGDVHSLALDGFMHGLKKN